LKSLKINVGFTEDSNENPTNPTLIKKGTLPLSSIHHHANAHQEIFKYFHAWDMDEIQFVEDMKLGTPHPPLRVLFQQALIRGNSRKTLKEY
jgi:hypothetical protein